MKSAEELSDRELRRRRFMAVGIFVALIGLIVSINLVTLRPSRDAATCQSNLKQVSMAMLQYVRDYDETYPLASNWSDALQPYRKEYIKFVRCPARSDLPFGYAMHASIAQSSLADITDFQNTIIYFDSDAGKPNQADKGSSLPPLPRHPKGHSIAFIDGHVKFVEVPNMKHGYHAPAYIVEVRKERQRQKEAQRRNIGAMQKAMSKAAKR